ncbi:MAG: phenylacetate--CoA ligase family protein [Nitrosomonadales bacterium]|nr:phenylacetate--CoA ligase family protein [Nitrosomonadales bacterium]
MNPATDPLGPSHIAGIAWPPLVEAQIPQLPPLMQKLERTQWLAPHELRASQHRQLAVLAAHAQNHSPHFRARLHDAGLQPQDLSSPEGLRRLPLLTRRELQSAGQALFCTQLPATHQPLAETQTSGSSGEPVVVKRTAISQLFWMAETLREHLWQQRDFSGTLAVIRANYPAGAPEHHASWGAPTSVMFRTGPSHAMRITTDVAQQAEWLARIDPHYLLTYPTNLGALLSQIERCGIRLPRLRQIRTIGETLGTPVREAARSVLGVEIADTYSSQEVGVIALQCPHSGLYHIMAESLIVEVLDEHGMPCAPGQIGRIVLTDLHNLATPLVRYAINDYAEVGAACPCGRGLPTLKRIVGRERNMLLLPDGRRHWPLVGFDKYRSIAPIRQYQLIQRDRERIEVRLVAATALTATQETQLGALIHTALGHPFQLSFVYFDGEIPRSAGGKFDEFVCEARE